MCLFSEQICKVKYDRKTITHVFFIASTPLAWFLRKCLNTWSIGSISTFLGAWQMLIHKKTCAIPIFRPREINQISIQPKNFLVCGTLSPYLLLAKALESLADGISTLIQCTISLLESCMDPESFVRGGLNLITFFVFFLYFQFDEGTKDPITKY